MQRRNRRYSSTYGLARAAGSYMRYDPTLKHIRSAYNYATTPSAPRPNTAPAAPLRGKPVKRRKKTYKRKTKVNKKIDKCQKAIKDLSAKTDASLGTMTHRRVSSVQAFSQNNEQSAVISEINSKSQIESVLANLKFFDPLNPGTLVTASGTTGTYSRDYLIKSISQKLQVRNNYISDVQVKIYYCTAKEDTDLTPIQSWAAGIPDGGNAVSVTELCNYPSDYAHFRDLWNTKVVLNTTLSPGQSANVSNTIKSVRYDPAVFDTQIEQYQRDIKSGCFMVVFQGTASHGTGGTIPVGFQIAGLDFIQHTTYVVEYQAGANIKFVHIDNSLPSLSAGSVQSHQPIADNQSFSPL